MRLPAKLVSSYLHNDIRIFKPKFKKHRPWTPPPVTYRLDHFHLDYICLFQDKNWLKNHYEQVAGIRS